MTEWNTDPFSSPEADPEFGKLPAPPVRRYLAAWLGLSASSSARFDAVRATGWRLRIRLARRELHRLHTREQVRLLLLAARIRAHTSSDCDVRRRARALLPDPATVECLTLEDWREQCREELLSGRGSRSSAPRTLWRMCAREVEEWPSSSALVRVALRLERGVRVRFDLLRSSFVDEPTDGLRAELESLWVRAELADETRLELLRTLAVLHEVSGDLRRARACWELVLGRDPENCLAHVSCFAMRVAAGEEVEARNAVETLRSVLARLDSGRLPLHRALAERTRINRVTPHLPDQAQHLRLELLTHGDPLLTELCLGLG